MKKQVLKTVTVICVISVLICTVLPATFNTAALYDSVNDVTVYNFEPSSGVKGSTSDEVGSVIYRGNSFNIQDKEGSYCLTGWNPNYARNWATTGAFRLNDKDGTYTLKKNHTYTVKLDLKITSGIKPYAGLPETSLASLYLGYGINVSNSLAESLKVKLFNLATYGLNATSYVADTMCGTKTEAIAPNADWITETYVFTAPENADGEDLGFYFAGWYGATCYIDNVVIKDYGENASYFITVNTKSGERDIVAGKNGDTANIPVPVYESRNFKGWYDETGENKFENLTFGTPEILYGFFDGKTVITAKYGNETVKLEGDPGDKIILPEVPETLSGKKFIAFYTDINYTHKLTDEVFGIKDYTVYALYSDKVTVTLKDTVNKTSEKLNGYPGDEIKLPVPVDEKHVLGSDEQKLFTAWCTDSAATVKYEENVFPTTDTTLYSLWAGKADDVIIDFEKYAYTGTLVIGSPVIIEKNGGKDGSKGAVFTTGSDRTHGYFKIADVSGVTGRLFKVSYDYMVEDENETVYVNMLVSSSSGNMWANPYADKKYTQKLICDGNWHTCDEFYYVPGDYGLNGNTYTAKGLFISYEVNPDSNTKIHTDNVMLKAVTPAVSLVTMYLQNDEWGSYGDKIEDINTVGAAVKFPENISFGNRKFLGWATDENGENMYTETKHTPQNITLYAIWDKSRDAKVESFENFNTGDRNTFNASLLSVSSDKACHGDKSVKLAYNKEISETVGTSGINNCMRIMPVKDKTKYKITFKYYAEKSSVPVSVKLATSTVGNIWDPAGNTEYRGAYTIPAGSDASWCESTLYINTDVHENVRNPSNPANYLYFIFSMGGNDGETVIYFDDVAIVEIYDDLKVITFDDGNGGGGFFGGYEGDTVVYPEASAVFGKVFGYWAYDENGERPFTQKTLGNSDITVYAVYEPADKCTYDFENWTYSAYIKSNDITCETVNCAASGSKVIVADRDASHYENGLQWLGAHFGIGDSKCYVINANFNYIVEFKYYIAKKADENFNISFYVGDTNNVWNKQSTGSGYYNVETTEQTGVWHTGYFALDFDFTENENVPSRRGLMCLVNAGRSGLFYIDDVTIIKVPKGYSGIAVKSEGKSQIPKYAFAKIGGTYQNVIPQTPTRDGYEFAGYYNGIVNVTDWNSPENGINLTARWVEKTVFQGFEDNYLAARLKNTDYAVIDFDYELYDSEADGNTKENVVSGRYSLHRKGTSRYYENACLLNSGKLSGIHRYTITMYVKMDKYLHTDGAIKIASNQSNVLPWCLQGNYHSVVPIADLVDGEWHKIEYVFNSADAYLTIQTPGYCSIYIDDVTLTLTDKSVEPTGNCEYTEYIPLKRDENGNILQTSITDGINLDEIIDASLTSGKGKLSGAIWIYITAAAAVIIAAAVTGTVIYKKKKGGSK